MREEWKIVSIGEISELVTKGTTPTSLGYDFVNEGINFIKVESLTPNGKFLKEKVAYINDDCHNALKRSQLKKGDILFSIAGALGRTGKVIDDILPANTNQALAIIRLNKSNLYDSEYILRALSSGFLLEQIEKQRGGVAQQNLSLAQVKDFKIPLPPLPEQKRIVAILDEAFAAIDTAIANTEKNLKNAKELFESYLNRVFSEKGEGWEEKRLGDVCGFVRGPFGGSLTKSIFKDHGYVVYEQKHAIHNHFEQLRYFIDEDKFNEMKRFEVKAGDIIMSCSGVTLGRVAVVPENIPRGIINQALLKLTPKKTTHVEFLRYWLKSSCFQNIILEYSGGAAQPNVPSAKILKDIKICIPGISQQKLIVEKIELIIIKATDIEDIHKRKLALLKDLKQSILQKAFTGELTSKSIDNLDISIPPLIFEEAHP